MSLILQDQERERERERRSTSLSEEQKKKIILLSIVERIPHLVLAKHFDDFCRKQSNLGFQMRKNVMNSIEGLETDFFPVLKYILNRRAYPNPSSPQNPIKMSDDQFDFLVQWITSCRNNIFPADPTSLASMPPLYIPPTPSGNTELLVFYISKERLERFSKRSPSITLPGFYGVVNSIDFMGENTSLYFTKLYRGDYGVEHRLLYLGELYKSSSNSSNVFLSTESDSQTTLAQMFTNDSSSFSKQINSLDNIVFKKNFRKLMDNSSSSSSSSSSVQVKPTIQYSDSREFIEKTFKILKKNLEDEKMIRKKEKNDFYAIDEVDEDGSGQALDVDQIPCYIVIEVKSLQGIHFIGCPSPIPLQSWELVSVVPPPSE